MDLLLISSTGELNFATRQFVVFYNNKPRDAAILRSDFLATKCRISKLDHYDVDKTRCCNLHRTDALCNTADAENNSLGTKKNRQGM